MGSICAVTKLPCPAAEITGRTCSDDAGVDDIAACATKLIQMNLELKNDIADLEEYIQFLKDEEPATDNID
ncbi:MAG: hypothetical protein EB015_19450 [Methylocystaceae bacterium]|nr:hypothetical protein [Methylocystaceae bacterium]